MGIDLLFALLGLVILPVCAWTLSENPSRIMWRTVLVGLGLQTAQGMIVMLTTPGQLIFNQINDLVVGLLSFSNEGARFLFEDLIDKEFARATVAFSVLPTIVFFHH